MIPNNWQLHPISFHPADTDTIWPQQQQSPDHHKGYRCCCWWWCTFCSTPFRSTHTDSLLNCLFARPSRRFRRHYWSAALHDLHPSQRAQQCCSQQEALCPTPCRSRRRLSSICRTPIDWSLFARAQSPSICSRMLNMTDNLGKNELLLGEQSWLNSAAAFAASANNPLEGRILRLRRNPWSCRWHVEFKPAGEILPILIKSGVWKSIRAGDTVVQLGATNVCLRRDLCSVPIIPQSTTRRLDLRYCEAVI